jgi:YHS domain-containing protein
MIKLMRGGIFFTAIVLLAVFSACSDSEQKTTADEHMNSQEHAGHDMAKKQDAAVAAVSWNKYCPVSGDEVDPDVDTVSHDGKTWGFCCDMCIKKFKNDPATYAANINEDGSKYIGKEKGHM